MYRVDASTLDYDLIRSSQETLKISDVLEHYRSENRKVTKTVHGGSTSSLKVDLPNVGNETQAGFKAEVSYITEDRLSQLEKLDTTIEVQIVEYFVEVTGNFDTQEEWVFTERWAWVGDSCEAQGVAGIEEILRYSVYGEPSSIPVRFTYRVVDLKAPSLSSLTREQILKDAQGYSEDLLKEGRWRDSVSPEVPERVPQINLPQPLELNDIRFGS